MLASEPMLIMLPPSGEVEDDGVMFQRTATTPLTSCLSLRVHSSKSSMIPCVGVFRCGQSKLHHYRGYSC